MSAQAAARGLQQDWFEFERQRYHFGLGQGNLSPVSPAPWHCTAPQLWFGMLQNGTVMKLWWNVWESQWKCESDSIWLFQSESINIFLAAQFLFGCFSLCRRNALGKKLPLPRRSTWLFRLWYIRYVLRFVSRFNMKNHVAMQKRWKYSAEVKLSAVTML